MKQLRYILCLLISACLIMPAIAQQTRTIKGVVLDEKGEPAIGATVTVPDTKTGTVTDISGKFILPNIQSGQKSIQVSYIGYQTQTIDVTNKSELIVNLVQANAELDEVVVVGYGAQKKAHLTGAIATLAPQEITDLSVTNLSSALSGMMNGVSVSGGNTRPGESARINIRQYGIIVNGDTEADPLIPLYVIDDYISTEAAFNNLDPTMIENISVLKDAAAAVYGARSAQGVVLVKTKRGQVGAPKISYSGQFGFVDEVARTKMLDSYNYGLIWNAVRAANPTDIPDPRTDLFQADELAAMRNLNYDILEREWSAALTQKHSVNMSGGTDRANYFAGISYVTQDGNLGKIDYERWNYRAGVDAKINKWFKASLQVSGDNGSQTKAYSKVGRENPETDYNGLLSRPRYIPDYIGDYPIAAMGITNALESPLDAYQLYNFRAIQELGNYSKTSNQNTTINSSLEYDFGWSNILKGLKVKLSYSKNIITDKGNQFTSNYSIYGFTTRGGSGYHLYTDTEGYPLDLSSDNIVNLKLNNSPALARSMSRSDSYQMNFIASYARTFGKHDVSGLFTIERAENEWENLKGSMPNPYLFTNGQSKSASGASEMNPDGNTEFNRSESAMLSYVGRLNYIYSDKYLLEFLIRSDASTKFAPENYWGVFPSLSAGWIISEEPWFKSNINSIDFLKIRGSFGLLGRDNIKPWRWADTYGMQKDKGAIFGVNPSSGAGPHISIPDDAANRDSHWDKSYKTNGGIDIHVLNSKLTFNLDGYYDRYREVFMTRNNTQGYPSTVGAEAAMENFGSIDMYGIELSVNWKGKINNNFRYYIKVNTGYSDNKVLVAPWKTLIPYNELHPGQRSDIGEWGYESIGMFRSYQDIEEYFEREEIVSYMGLAKGDVRPGMLIYNNVRGSQKSDGSYYGPNDPEDPKRGYVDKDDMVKISNRSNPYGFTVNLGGDWKNLSFSAQVSANWGGYSIIPKQARSASSLISTATGYDVLQYTNLPSFWAGNMFVYEDVLDAQNNVIAAKNVDAKYPNLRYNINGETSTFWRVSGTRVALRNITIAYALPQAWAKALSVESCRLNLTGQNLLSLYNPYPDKFMDPLTGSYGQYPALRRFTLGVNVSF